MSTTTIATTTTTTTTTGTSKGDAMEVDALRTAPTPTRVPQAEIDRRRRAGECLKCGLKGHKLHKCQIGWRYTPNNNSNSSNSTWRAKAATTGEEEKKEAASVKEVEQEKSEQQTLEEVRAMLAKLLKTDKVEETPKSSF